MNNSSIKTLQQSLLSALETYSNVHRGNGPASDITTSLYEKSREMVVRYLNLDPAKYTVVFGSPWAINRLYKNIGNDTVRLQGTSTGLNLGIDAVICKKKQLKTTKPLLFGGGTALLYDKEWVMYDDGPARFEAGTPPIMNVLAFTLALQLSKAERLQWPTSKTNPLQAALLQGNCSKYEGMELLYNVRDTMIGKNTLIPTLYGWRPYLHFDNASSTPAMAESWRVFFDTLFLDTETSNEVVQQSRQLLSQLLHAPSDQFDILFASNTTEAINIVAESLKNNTQSDTEPVIVSSMLEHSSNDLPWRMVKNHSIVRIGVDKDGFFDKEQIRDLLKRYNETHEFGHKRISILCLNAASNITGAINHFEEIAKLAHSYGALLLIDAAQLIAHRSINMEQSQIDFMVCSGHKTYAPFGSGMLIARKKLLHFGEQEMMEIRQSAESNPGGIAAMTIALVTLYRIGFKAIETETQALESIIRRQLATYEQLQCFGLMTNSNELSTLRTPVISFVHNGMMSSKIASRLAKQSAIGIRYGCMCAHLFVKQLHNFTAFQTSLQKTVLRLIPALRLQGVARISLGIQHTDKEVDILLQSIESILRKQTVSSTSKENILSNQQRLSRKTYKEQYQNFLKERIQKVYAPITDPEYKGCLICDLP